MKIDVVTIFPGYLEPLTESLVGRARERDLLEIGVHDLRHWTDDVHRSVDDPPYGGGPGMVMRPEPWARALEAVRPYGARLVVPTPAGRPFTQAMATAYALEPHLVFACGRYEGIDQRVIDWAAENGPVDEVSLGDYVLAGGEVAVLVIVEALARLVPGVLGNLASAADDSHSTGLLEGPSYTRPASWRGYGVPEVLLSGDHGAIADWRHQQSVARTRQRRPDLLSAAESSQGAPATLSRSQYSPDRPSPDRRGPAVRAASRVIVIDRSQRVLLFGVRMVDLDRALGDVLWWCTPGGGLDPRESLRAAAVRELAEEIGLQVTEADLEGPVWLRRWLAPLLGRDVDSRETFFALRDVDHIVDAGGQTEIERFEQAPYRWWTLAEIGASRESFAPRDLAQALPEVLAGPWSGPPRIVDVQGFRRSGLTHGGNARG